MKKLFALAMCLVFIFSFSFKKEKKFIPPGTAPITETFFADETEVSNFSWVEYELWVRTKYGAGSSQHLAVLPDTLVWRDKVSYNEPYVKYYYRHPAYREYPVVGVSFEQVQAYCKWRTERVKEFYAIHNKKELNIEYRLPSKDEWELISNHGVGVISWNNGLNKKGLMTLNCVRDMDTVLVSGATDVTAPVYSYWKNNFGLFNAFGNVAEMISEKGICKGGSWRHRIEDCRAGKDLFYSKPEAWLGFRCVCTLTQVCR